MGYHSTSLETSITASDGHTLPDNRLFYGIQRKRPFHVFDVILAGGQRRLKLQWMSEYGILAHLESL